MCEVITSIRGTLALVVAFSFANTEGLELLLGTDIGECLLPWIHRTVLIPKAQPSGPRA